MARNLVKGGKNLERFIKNLKAAPRTSVENVEVGFFRTARYQGGQYVATVAAVHEFGAGPHSERPFFRTALKNSDQLILETVEQTIDPLKLEFDRRVAGTVGAVVKGAIQKSVRDFGVIDTGHLRRSVEWKIEEN